MLLSSVDSIDIEHWFQVLKSFIEKVKSQNWGMTPFQEKPRPNLQWQNKMKTEDKKQTQRQNAASVFKIPSRAEIKIHTSPPVRCSYN